MPEDTSRSNAAERAPWRTNSFFDGLPADLLDAVEPLLEHRVYAAGDPIVLEGDPSDCICLLASGGGAVFLGADEVPVNGMRAGEFFGEMGLLRDTPRSATVRAAGPTQVYSLGRAALDTLRTEQGVDLLSASMRSQASVLVQRLDRVSHGFAGAARERLEEYRIRAAFGSYFSNVILLLFFYVTGLGLLRKLSSTGSSSTLTTSALLVGTAAGAAVLAWRTGFPAAYFGLTLRRWRFVLLDSLLWTGLLCVGFTVAKAIWVGWSHPDLPVLKPWVSDAGVGATIVAYALYAVLTPVQEFVARGVMQGSLQRMLVGRYVTLRAIIVSNAIFSLSHQHLGIGYALAVLPVGLFWGWMYARHDSLLGVCLSHIIIGLWGTGMLDLAAVVEHL